ncbi:fructan 1-exohydrolase-like isoform X3 [Hordeum vulgare subsp. vulgare]|uniref:fructan 1-exohydrolase-like isoform X3 n=1 Tax=Hordeum vulgare subsp. vulgare TaxID=112509 RepID=UPI000B470997|nr:fructan 1-exohydrolase-like isoform X3 [Hordeum vulgare subsp. vulgare]
MALPWAFVLLSALFFLSSCVSNLFSSSSSNGSGGRCSLCPQSPEVSFCPQSPEVSLSPQSPEVPSIFSMRYKTAYHFQPSRNWINDTIVDDCRLWLKIDYGNFYASRSFVDSKKGRRIIWGWSKEADRHSDDVAKGWAGIHTIPRTIWLDSDGKQLLQWPVDEIESLRTNEINHQGLELNKGDLFEINGVDTFQADVEINFELTSIDDADPFDPSWLLDPDKHCCEAGASVHGGIGPFGLVILASNNMDEHTAVHFRVYKSQQKYMILMCSDLRRSSMRSGLCTPAYGGFFEFDLEKERKISLRTLIDRSAVESYGGGGRACITARVYPVFLAVDGKAHMYAFNNGSTTVRVPQLKAWTMRKAKVNVE